MDKAFWHAVIDDSGDIPNGRTLAELTQALDGYLGLPDGELRDEIAYRLLTQWIMAGKYPPDDLRRLMARWLDNLTIGIGETEADSVFLRSFSVLMLSVVVYHDNNQPFLTRDEVRALLDKGLAYFAAEQDLRGYVIGKGWAHSSAHCADLLKFLARSRHMDTADLRRILDGIVLKLLAPIVHMYGYDEDERMALAAVDVCKRGLLTPDDWRAWLARFTEWKARWSNDDPFNLEIFAPYHNGKQFLRTLYFQISFLDPAPPGAEALMDDIMETLKTFR
jgi:hypothetical protein